MSNTYADALQYFRTKLKAGPEPVDLNLTTEGEVGPQVDQPVIEQAGSTPEPPRDASSNATHRPSVDASSSGSQMKLPDVDTRRTSVKTPPQVKPYEPSPRPVRRPGEDEASWRVRWRRWQVDEQVAENMLAGAIKPVLRGKKNLGVCFGNCPPFNCTCHDGGAFNL